MVVIPALGVAATLRAGESLEAPPPVGGEWRVDPVASGCARASGVLTLEQSGHRVDALYSVPDGASARLSGDLRGGVLTLEHRGEGCERVESRLSQSADVDSVASLSAIVQSGACGCRATEATLVRVVPLATRGH